MLHIPSIRLAGSEDAQSVFEFIQGFARRFGSVSCENSSGQMERKRVIDFIKKDGAVGRIRDQLASEKPPFQCLIAENQSIPVGGALYFPAFSDWTHSSYPWLEDLYAKDITDAGDNRIICKELIRTLVRDAVSDGAPRIETRSLVADRDTRVFYTELGMSITSEWEGFRVDLPAPLRTVPSNGFSVRLADKRDMRSVAMFIQSSARVQGVADKVNRKNTIEKLESCFDSSAFECVIAERRGVANGFAVFYQAYSSWEQCSYLMIEDLHSFFSRQGTGLALISRVYDIAEKRGLSRVETRIRQSSLSAPSAVKFVEAMGMRKVPGPRWRTFRMELTSDVLKGLGLYDLVS